MVSRALGSPFLITSCTFYFAFDAFTKKLHIGRNAKKLRNLHTLSYMFLNPNPCEGGPICTNFYY